MISSFDLLRELFSEIDRGLRDKAQVFVIGGAMLLYHGLKPATKDIDVVVGTGKEFGAIADALRRIGFEAKAPTQEYSRMDLSEIFERADFRIDLFRETVCRGFSLSAEMRRRADTALDLERLTISICSREDVFLFKTLTQRDGDLDDCIALAKQGLDWDAMLKELKAQITAADKPIWITWVGERLDTLRERGLDIPIMREIDEMRDEYFKEYEKAFQ